MCGKYPALLLFVRNNIISIYIRKIFLLDFMESWVHANDVCFISSWIWKINNAINSDSVMISRILVFVASGSIHSQVTGWWNGAFIVLLQTMVIEGRWWMEHDGKDPSGLLFVFPHPSSRDPSGLLLNWTHLLLLFLLPADRCDGKKWLLDALWSVDVSHRNPTDDPTPIIPVLGSSPITAHA